MSRDVPVKHGLNGNLDMDSDPRNVREGNYMSAMDIIKQDDAGGVSGTVQPTQRNEHAFSLGSVQAQNKRYRITVDGDATKTHRIRFLSTKKDTPILTSTVFFPLTVGFIDFQGTLSSLVNAVTASVASSGISWSLSTAGNSLEVELTEYPHYQWYIESDGVDDVLIECIREAIPTDLAGPLKDIGNYDLLGDLYVLSTSQDSLPEETDLEVILVGPLLGTQLSGPLTRLTFNQAHALSQGQWVQISNSTAPWLNGTFVIHAVVSPTEVDIVTDTAWGALHPNTFGGEVVTINPTGIGEIGVAQNDDNADAWTYTRLLRSVELGMVLKKAIRADGRRKAERDIIYFTDNYNQISGFSYKGAVIEDGGLSFISSDNIYVYDSIKSQMSLTSYYIGDEATLSLRAVNSGGGSLPVGNKYYVAQFLDPFDSPSKWSEPLGPVSIYEEGNTADPPLIKGAPSGTPTSKSVTIDITGIAPNIFAKIRVAVITNSNGATEGNIFYESSLQPEATAVSVTHTGNETGELLDLGEYIASFARLDIFKAGDLAIIDKRLVLGNITYQDDLKIEGVAERIQHRLEYTNIDGTDSGPYNKDFGGYIDPMNIVSTPALVLNETYRVGIEFLFKTNRSSKVYWVDDITIDTEGTNLANPTDNRRVPGGGLPDYALTTDAAHGFELRAPTIVFSNIDLNLLVEGYALRDIVASVRFRFAPVIKEVLSSGFVVLGVSGLRSNTAVVTPIPTTHWGWVLDILFPGTFLGSIFDPTSGGGFTTDFSVHGSSFTDGANDQANIIPYPDWNEEWTFDGHPDLAQAPIVAIPDGVGTYPGRWTRGDLAPGGATYVGKHRDYAAFYSTDVSQGGMDSVSLISGDELLVYFPLKRVNPRVINSDMDMQGYNLSPNNTTPLRGTPSSSVSLMAHPTGTGQGDVADLARSQTMRRIQIVDSATIAPGEKETVDGEVFANTFNEFVGGGALQGTFATDAQVSQWLSTEKFIGLKLVEDVYPADGIANSGVPSGTTWWGNLGADSGVYYAQIRRPVADKYGDKSNTTYTAYSVAANASAIPNTGTEVRVSGGEAFITSSLIRWRAWDPNNASRDYIVGFNLAGLSKRGRFLGLNFVSQSYMNMDLVHQDPSGEVRSYPEDYSGDGYLKKHDNWVQDIHPAEVITEPAQNFYPQFYNQEFSPDWGFLTHSAINVGREEITKLPARLAYSERDIYSSIRDSMREFSPLNIHDLDTTFGPIEVVTNTTGELFTIQQRRFQLQYFNARGTLQASSTSVEVLLGDGGVLSRDGRTLSSYGTHHKWSCIKGSSQGGKDVIYWFNQENGLFLRFGDSGTAVISDHRRMRAFTSRTTRWTTGKHTHAHSYGVRGVWDERFKEAIWTFTGVREVPEYTPAGIFTPTALAGTVVSNPNAPIDTFEELPRLFRAIDSHPSFPQNEPGVGADWEQHWEQISYEDKEYYSVFTLAYNELTGGFSTFYNHLPKTYLKWKNKFLSSHPVHRSEIYEHRRGYDDWYTFEGVGKPAQAYIEPVINALPEATKKFIAVQALATTAPDRVEFKTENHESFLEAIEYERNDDGWRSPIKQDSTITGDPTTGEESLFGSYIRAKLIWNNGSTNRIHNFIVKVRERLRRYTV